MKMSCQLHATTALHSKKELRYPVDSWADEPHRLSARYGGDKNPALMEIELRPSSQ
jgi:hypothetical protein